MTTAAPSDVRTWAREQGLTSSQRGPLPRAVLAAYAVAHGGAHGNGTAAARHRATPARRTSEPAATRPDRAGLEERLQAVEAQLATALARLGELEHSRPRRLLGLNVTL